MQRLKKVKYTCKETLCTDRYGPDECFFDCVIDLHKDGKCRSPSLKTPLRLMIHDLIYSLSFIKSLI